MSNTDPNSLATPHPHLHSHVPTTVETPNLGRQTYMQEGLPCPGGKFANLFSSIGTSIPSHEWSHNNRSFIHSSADFDYLNVLSSSNPLADLN